MKTLIMLLIALAIATAAQSQSAGKLYKSGMACYERQDLQGAMYYFTLALGKNPKLAEAYYYRGLARKSEKWNATIILDGVHVNNSAAHITMVPEYKQTVTKDGHNWVICRLPDPGKTKDSLDGIIKANPADVKAWFARGRTRWLMKDYQGAIDDLTQTLVINPTYPEAHFIRGNAKNSLKDYDGAIADFTKAIEINPESGTALLLRSEARMSIHDTVGSQSDFEKALKVKNDSPTMVFNCEGTLNSPGHSYEIDDYTMAIKLKPDYADAYFHRGLASIKIQQKESGCSDFIKAKELGNAEAAEQIGKYCK